MELPSRMMSHLSQSCPDSSDHVRPHVPHRAQDEAARAGTNLSWSFMARCALLANNAELTRLRLDAEQARGP